MRHIGIGLLLLAGCISQKTQDQAIQTAREWSASGHVHNPSIFIGIKFGSTIELNGVEGEVSGKATTVKSETTTVYQTTTRPSTQPVAPPAYATPELPPMPDMP